MREAVLICRPPHATPEWQQQAALHFTRNGWSCDLRERFDHVLMVAILRDAGLDDVDPADLKKELREANLWLETTEIKIPVQR